MQYYQMLKEMESLSERENKISRQLTTYPEGKFIYSRNGKFVKWYRSCQGIKTYIPRKDREMASVLAEKKYYEAVMQDILQEKQAIQEYLNLCVGEKSKEEEILKNKVYEDLLKNAFVSEKQELSEWEKQKYERCFKYPEQLVHTVPMLDGQKVRSKSEAIIASLLHVNRIPFHYEEALRVGQRVIYPDFTIRHPMTGKFYYWEHFGMMNNENYAQSAFHKMQLYNENGILLSDTLLATYESAEIPLKSDLVENIIQRYFL